MALGKNVCFVSANILSHCSKVDSFVTLTGFLTFLNIRKNFGQKDRFSSFQTFDIVSTLLRNFSRLNYRDAKGNILWRDVLTNQVGRFMVHQ